MQLDVAIPDLTRTSPLAVPLVVPRRADRQPAVAQSMSACAATFVVNFGRSFPAAVLTASRCSATSDPASQEPPATEHFCVAAVERTTFLPFL
ncbi:hypothetical protein GCM10009559_42850 [Pseudonocardia zijingensis]|uniref:Uncharacterized protein n=1 Tax=Pseudonocardia zijingensis TaxID=153376 RepID=A0ABN1QNW0_9PSEU